MDLHISLAAETLFHVGPIPVTNSMLTMFIVMAIILVVFSVLARKVQLVPGRAQGLLEMIVEFLLNMVESAGGKTLGRRIFPLVSGIFIFILFANLSGLIPGMGTVGIREDEAAEANTHEESEEVTDATPPTGVVGDETSDSTPESAAAGTVGDENDGGDDAAAISEDEEHEPALVPILRAPTADLNMTFALSLLTFTVVQIAGVSAHGVGGRIKHMADPPFLFPIELISEFSRILSLAARLFGNVFAGEVLLGVMYAMGAAIKIAVVPFLFPVLFLGLELLFGTIQALVFALLTLIYITLAAGGHEDDHDEARAHGHEGRATATPQGAAAAASGD